MDQEKKVYEYLDALSIVYQRYKHPAVYTVEQARKHRGSITGGQVKNLFLRNSKGKHHYLIVLEQSKKLDIKALQTRIGASKLSFASAKRLEKYLGVTPGSVSPFALINDLNHEVETYIDADLMDYEQLNFHPNVNTVTLTISSADFKKFLEHTGNDFYFLHL
ncbi:MAG: prolyl-tRNA synthetase associated domain-containing protein [Deltaproteobacteria bacterium]|nr:prolyl-tRNA synthetase associated domain-containing protein [Deltaproteobacteria bacterium]